MVRLKYHDDKGSGDGDGDGDADDLYDGSTLVRHGKSRNRTKRGLAKHTQPSSTWRALEGKKPYKHIHNLARQRKPRRGPNKAVKQQANHNLTQPCSTKEASQGDENKALHKISQDCSTEGTSPVDEKMPYMNSHSLGRHRKPRVGTKRSLMKITQPWSTIESREEDEKRPCNKPQECNTVQNCKVQHAKVEHHTVEHSIVFFSVVQGSVLWYLKVWYGMF